MKKKFAFVDNKILEKLENRLQNNSSRNILELSDQEFMEYVKSLYMQEFDKQFKDVFDKIDELKKIKS